MLCKYRIWNFDRKVPKMYKEQTFFFPDALNTFWNKKARLSSDVTCIDCCSQVEDCCICAPCNNPIDLSIKRTSRRRKEVVGKPFLLPFNQQPKDQLRKNFFPIFHL